MNCLLKPFFAKHSVASMLSYSLKRWDQRDTSTSVRLILEFIYLFMPVWKFGWHIPVAQPVIHTARIYYTGDILMEQKCTQTLQTANVKGMKQSKEAKNSSTYQSLSGR